LKALHLGLHLTTVSQILIEFWGYLKNRSRKKLWGENSHLCTSYIAILRCFL